MENFEYYKSFSLDDIKGILANMAMQSEKERQERAERIKEQAERDALQVKERAERDALQAKERAERAKEQAERDALQAKERAEWQERMKQLEKLYGGMAESNGAIAEDYFFDVLSDSYELAGIKYSTADRNIHRKTKQMECEYDIVLYNSHKIIVVEVKYKLHIKYVREFQEEKLPKFKKLYPEYRGYEIIGAVAAMTVPQDSFELAKEYGFLVLTQKNKHLTILNDKKFKPKNY